MNILKTEAGQDVQKDAVEYEAPAVESVVLPEDIERQVGYAGDNVPSGVVLS